jgi:PAS domain S-box-containing protein
VHPYHLALAAGSVISAVCAGYLLAQNPRRRDSQLASLVLLGAAWWGICQFAWNLAPDAAAARRLMRLSVPGWAFLGPMILHAFARSGERASEKLGGLIAVLYAASVVYLVLGWTTDFILKDMVRTSWGWQYTFGPAFAPYLLSMMVGVGWTVYELYRGGREDTASSGERQRLWLFLPCLIPLTVSAVTDVLLPILGFQFPVLGATSFAALGLIAVWSVHRYGYFPISPGNFANQILDTLPDGVLLVRTDGSTHVANPGLVQLSGYTEQELLHMPWSELLVADTGRVDSGAASDAYDLCAASGERIPVLVKSSDLSDRLGNAMGMVLAVRDVREVEELRTRVILSARLAAVGELAAGVAHEINNPIAFVRSNLSQLQTHWKTLCRDLEEGIRGRGLGELAEEGGELIEESMDGVDRAAEIVRGIRSFSHGGSGRDRANLNRLIEDVLHMAASQMQSDVTVERYYVELPPVLCAQQELKQVLLNLIVNAGHAVADGGKIRITTGVDGDWVCAHVQDDGDGIPPEIIDRIFDPFFTTRDAGEGTGLGLGIAYQIAKSHGGAITVESTPGEGACFHLRLPCLPPEAENLPHE